MNIRPLTNPTGGLGRGNMSQIKGNGLMRPLDSPVLLSEALALVRYVAMWAYQKIIRILASLMMIFLITKHMAD